MGILVENNESDISRAKDEYGPWDQIPIELSKSEIDSILNGKVYIEGNGETCVLIRFIKETVDNE